MGRGRTAGRERDTVGVYAVVITGAPGSGKSKTLEALSDRLHDHDITHACIDADALSWAHPAPSAEVQMRHVAALAGLYGEEGHDLLLLAAGIASTAELKALLGAVQADAAFVGRLLASPETLRDRITAREPAGWSQLPSLLERAGQMGAATAVLEADLVIDTERTDPQAAAAEICDACSRLSGTTRRPPRPPILFRRAPFRRRGHRLFGRTTTQAKGRGAASPAATACRAGTSLPQRRSGFHFMESRTSRQRNRRHHARR